MRPTGQPGNFGPYADRQGGIDLLHRARALGLQHIDTARAYGPHHDERLIGAALRAADGTFGEMFVASKGGVEKDADGIARDTRPETMARHVDESLANLGVGTVDHSYLHAPEGRTPVAEIEAAMAVAPIAAVQNRCSPADETDPAEEAAIDWLAGQGVACVPHGPLGAHPMRRGAVADPAGALRALLARAPNLLVIPGTTRLAHLEANAAAMG